jgi:polyphosphate:AMP phosphotransferase
MFESAQLGHKIDKSTYKEQEPLLREALLAVQYQLKEQAHFPVVILLGGVPTAGKAETANLLLEWLDPRLIESHAFGIKSDEELARPAMWRYWRALPPKGKIALMFGGWYAGPMWDYLQGGYADRFEHEVERIARFEKMLADEGVLLLKFWLHLPKDELKQRIKKLEADDRTAWRVTKQDKQFLKHYDQIMEAQLAMVMRSNLADAPWRVIEGSDANYRSLTVGKQVEEAIKHHLARATPKQNRVEAAPLLPSIDGLRLLDKLELDGDLSKADYAVKLEELQGRLNLLTRHPKFKNTSVSLVFEGMDAAGKGGSIRRITAALDARQYRVVPIAAPTEEERAQPYLWRFWRHVPQHGRMTIFDRSWYGRVLVERVEGFAPRADWMRAYNEINDFEAELDAANSIVLKFWLAISKEEQLRRFEEREKIEFKRFKITDEDWRNRDKWDEYIVAASDMIDRTNTLHAPWHMIGANNKYQARISILEKLCEALESRLQSKDKKK